MEFSKFERMVTCMSHHTVRESIVLLHTKEAIDLNHWSRTKCQIGVRIGVGLHPGAMCASSLCYPLSRIEARKLFLCQSFCAVLEAYFARQTKMILFCPRDVFSVCGLVSALKRPSLRKYNNCYMHWSINYESDTCRRPLGFYCEYRYGSFLVPIK